MFEDVFNNITLQKLMFSETVRDEFGNSILTDVFEPILNEICSLQQLDELFQSKIIEIDQLTEEIKSIGTLTYE